MMHRGASPSPPPPLPVGSKIESRASTISRLTCFSLTAAFALGAIGCGPELESPAQVTNLRVLGVQKDLPYARPGETVRLSLLWENGTEESPQPVQTFWLKGCYDPPADLFSGCVARFAEAAIASESPEAFFAENYKQCDAEGDCVLGADGLGADQFDITLPDNIVRPVIQDPAQPPFGTAFVFFGVCTGQLDPTGLADVPDEPGAFPMPDCLDEDGKKLGPDDYIVGYSTIYAYDDFSNENPIVQGFQVAGQEVEVDCIGTDCVATQGDETVLTECTEGFACIDTCEDDGDPSCPEIDIRPIVDRASAEPDTVAIAAFGRDLEESLWINYLVDRGDVRGQGVRLLNDANTGWNDDFGTDFYAPKEPGPLRIWAVVHDNRGGVNWVRVPAFVR